MLVYPHLSARAGRLLQQQGCCCQDPAVGHQQVSPGTGHWATHLLPLTTCLCLMPVRVSLVYVSLCNPGPINNVFAVLPAAHSLEVLVVVLLSNSPELVVLFALTFQDKSSLSRCYKVLFP